MIQVEHLTFEYPGTRALDNVSFAIAPGSITALVGPNGAGKTTLLRCVAALDSPLAGTISVDGMDVSKHPREVHRTVGYLSDFFGLYDQLTVRRSLTYMAWSHQISDGVEELVENTAGLCELTDYLETKAGALSRGLRQRLGIGQAIIHKPKLLLLDEPASGLDPEARTSLSELFLDLRDAGATILVSSHILAELEDYSTEMLILREGRIVEHKVIAESQAKDTLAKQTVLLSFTGNASLYLAVIAELDGVSDINVDGNSLSLSLEGGAQEQHRLLKAVIDRGLPVCGFTPHKQRMQDIYMGFAEPKKDTGD